MKLDRILLATGALFFLLPACGEPDPAESGDDPMQEVDAIDIDKAAEDAAAEIDESTADEALDELEKEIAGDDG